RWPAVVRWLEIFSLEGLERLVLRCRPLQRVLLAVHERAFRRLLPGVGPVWRGRLVWGGPFPPPPPRFPRLFSATPPRRPLPQCRQPGEGPPLRHCRCRVRQ